ncbi:LamG-like jellyroll fold domain-containing protein [Cyclobacterium xiamenense]|uniref:LamG-like jellyroll fold domain-containing protein n=1 Tax=Cyclobacterium xiamenense TaxID=1297121 RepID=UPI0035CEC6AF
MKHTINCLANRTATFVGSKLSFTTTGMLIRACTAIFCVLSGFYNPLFCQQVSSVSSTDYEVKVLLPENFPEAGKQYPLLCVLEGDKYGQLAAEIARDLHRQGRGLSLIVASIAVKNPASAYFPQLTYKERFTPSQMEGESLWEWIENDLFPGLASKYPIAPYRILAGRGEGGFFTMSTMLYRPRLFHAYLAAAPTVYRLAEPEREYRRFLVGNMDFSASVYLTVGWGDQEPMMETMKFARLMQSHSLERPMSYRFEMIQQETNAGIMKATISKGLSHLFEDIRLTTMLPNGGIEGWRSRQKALVKKYGYDPIGMDLPPVSVGQDLQKLLGLPAELIEAQARVYLADLEKKYINTADEVLSTCAYWNVTGEQQAARALARAALARFPGERALQALAAGKDAGIQSPFVNSYGPMVSLDRGLAAYLSFDRRDEEVVFSGVELGEGKRGNAAYFSGNNSTITLDNAVLNGHAGSFSFAAWVWIDEHRNFDRLLGKPAEDGQRPVWQFGLGPVGDLQWGLSTFNNSWKDYWINRPFPSKTWMHLCVVADQSQGRVRYYLNGEWVGEVHELWPFPSSSAPVLLGCNAMSKNNFSGKLDEVYLYARALSPNEVRTLYEDR